MAHAVVDIIGSQQVNRNGGRRRVVDDRDPKLSYGVRAARLVDGCDRSADCQRIGRVTTRRCFIIDDASSCCRAESSVRRVEQGAAQRGGTRISIADDSRRSLEPASWQGNRNRRR